MRNWADCNSVQFLDGKGQAVSTNPLLLLQCSFYLYIDLSFSALCVCVKEETHFCQDVNRDHLDLKAKHPLNAVLLCTAFIICTFIWVCIELTTLAMSSPTSIPWYFYVQCSASSFPNPYSTCMFCHMRNEYIVLKLRFASIIPNRRLENVNDCQI